MKYIIANWKMNPNNLKEAKKLFLNIEKGLENVNLKNKRVVICPPYLYLFKAIKNKFKKLNLGAQNCFWENKGAFTGEISPLQLKDLGVKYVILGHSERRIKLNETYDMVSKKILACFKENLISIICFGSEDTLIEKEKYEIEDQIKKTFSNLKKLDKISEKIIIAYEPVWAISSNKKSISATPKHASEIIDFIKNILLKKYNLNVTAFLYGGSVNSKNIESFIEQENISGVLIGGVSLEIKEFIQTIKNI